MPFNGGGTLSLYSFSFKITPGFGPPIRYAAGGLSESRTKAIHDVQRILARRQQDVPGEKIEFDPSDLKFDVSEEFIQQERIRILKDIPIGMSARELTNGSPGYLMHRSIEQLVHKNESQDFKDINQILR